MAEIKYTNEQIQELENNKYVKSCTNKNINFTKEFKIKALKLEEEGMFRNEIFEKSGFPEYIINSKIPTKSINRWKNNINTKGLIEENKGRKKKEFDPQKMNKDEYIKYLEMKLEVLEELKKLTDGNYP